ncbi:MAG TPA: site-specific integrase, partial [Anaerohalosphaeraceae bacterium]|nr:site-specific integrase [Anaerohalosphaeraceae bacterium]
MAVYKRKRKNKSTGKVEESRAWFIRFIDHYQREHTFAAGSDQAEARKLEKRLLEVVGCRKSGFYPADVSIWLDCLPGRLRHKLSRWDLLPGGLVAAGIPLAQHLCDWKEYLAASGITQAQAEQQHARVERVFKEAGYIYWPDLSAEKTKLAISRMHKLVYKKKTISTGKPISAGTRRHYLKASKQFSKWMESTGRAANDPLRLAGFKQVQIERRRRALSRDEIICLLAYTRRAGVLYGMPGPERALCYQLAIESGLRRGELRALKRSSFDFEACTIRLDPQDTKNRKGGTLPVKAGTMELLKEHLSGKMPNTPAFRLTNSHSADMFKTDLAEARQEWIDSAKDNPIEHRRRVESDFLKEKTAQGRIDFHSTRHTFASLLIETGVNIKCAQTLLRHSNPALTLGVYAHTQDKIQTEAIQNLPDFDPEPQAVFAAKTGTDDFLADAIGAEKKA